MGRDARLANAGAVATKGFLLALALFDQRGYGRGAHRSPVRFRIGERRVEVWNPELAHSGNRAVKVEPNARWSDQFQGSAGAAAIYPCYGWCCGRPSARHGDVAVRPGAACVELGEDIVGAGGRTRSSCCRMRQCAGAPTGPPPPFVEHLITAALTVAFSGRTRSWCARMRAEHFASTAKAEG